MVGDRRGRAFVLSWLLPFGVLVIAIVAVPIRMLDAEGLPRYRLLRTELGEIHAENRRLEREVTRMRAEVLALRNDPAAVERVARDELGMVQQGEVVFQFTIEGFAERLGRLFAQIGACP